MLTTAEVAWTALISFPCIGAVAFAAGWMCRRSLTYKGELKAWNNGWDAGWNAALGERQPRH